MSKLLKLVVKSSEVFPQGGWPETFERDEKTWKKDHATVDKQGVIRSAEYTDGHTWLVVYGPETE